ncbi:MAG: 5-oxoprolinase subunit PxpA [Bacillota bacterium]
MEGEKVATSVRVDLNCDMGESFGAYRIHIDRAVLERISSANVACGFHAGDPMAMEETVALCKEYGVAVGAHPGFPDLMGFGRREMKISPTEARNYLIYQVGALKAFCDAAGVELQHVKLHGAFYNMAANDTALGQGVIEGLLRLRPRPIVLGLAGSRFVQMAREAGLVVREEVFADRAYNRDGTLVSRREAGAAIHEPDVVARRALRMVKDGLVESIDGYPVRLRADSICVHGDNPGAAEIVVRLAETLRREGVEIVPLRALA